MIGFLITGITLILVYEIWSIKNHTVGDTISEIVWKLAKRPIVPFAFGVLMGHFFW
jgi:hypothetical protein